MKERFIRAIVPYLIILTCMAYCWAIFGTSDINPMSRHYVGLVLFLWLTVSQFINSRIFLVSVGGFLLLGTFNLLAITPSVSSWRMNLGDISTPPVQLSSLAILFVYFCLNIDRLCDIYLDWRAHGGKAFGMDEPKINRDV